MGIKPKIDSGQNILVVLMSQASCGYSIPQAEYSSMATLWLQLMTTLAVMTSNHWNIFDH